MIDVTLHHVSISVTDLARIQAFYGGSPGPEEFINAERRD